MPSSSSFAIIDFSHWVYRHYFVNQNMVRPDGHPIGAVSGCCEALWRLVKSGPDYAAVVRDGGPDQRRKIIYPDYKAQRPPVPEGLQCQFDLCARAIEVFGFASVRIDGCEADDVVAHLALEALESHGLASVIHTTDKDLMQIVRPGISINYLVGNKLMTEADVFAKYGVRPEQIACWLALMGDASDNIPGVPKVGEKTAAKLCQIGDLSEIIEAANDGDERIGKAVRESLIENAWLARKSHQLTTWSPVKDLPPSASLAYTGYEIDRILAFCDEMGVSVVADNIRAAA
jgi:DNA polymerase-1